MYVARMREKPNPYQIYLGKTQREETNWETQELMEG